ncbi:MAG: hypothetical protein HY921_06240 [Elusimicrobia bacterium]|nr:hypothetical protein [Elusimicrobiota bacterium]
MRKYPPAWAFVLSAAFAAALPAGAEVQLQQLEWQLGRPAKTQAARFEAIPVLSLAGATLPGKIRVKLTLVNRGPKPVEGILLRYSVAARVAPKGRSQDGTWALPFMLEEKRVPKVGPNQIREVPLVPSMLGGYLLKLDQAGYAADQVKIQAMQEPRAGESYPVRVLESILEVRP